MKKLTTGGAEHAGVRIAKGSRPGGKGREQRHVRRFPKTSDFKGLSMEGTLRSLLPLGSSSCFRPGGPQKWLIPHSRKESQTAEIREDAERLKYSFEDSGFESFGRKSSAVSAYSAVDTFFFISEGWKDFYNFLSNKNICLIIGV